MTAGQGNCLTDAVVEEQAVGQAGERVALGQMSNLLGQGVGHADVAKDQYRAGNRSFAVADGRDGVFDVDFMAVAADEDAVQRQSAATVQRHRFGHRVLSGDAGGGVHDMKRVGQG